jgi:hypothetical protein
MDLTPNRKGEMKSLLKLHLTALADAGALCHVDTARDAESLTRRYEHEGDPFLTITLPTFAKDLEKGLRNGVWPETNPRFDRRSGLPVLLRGFLLRVFDDNGCLLDDPDANCIWAVRQICYLTQKVERPVSSERLDEAFRSFIETDDALDDHFIRLSANMPWLEFQEVTLKVYGPLFDKLERDIANFELIPSHGPGAVADRLDHPERWEFPYWPERLESVFPSWRYTRNLPEYGHVNIIARDSELPVRVVAVPKTQSAPRIIAIEPSAMQYAQQALKAKIYDYVEKLPLRDLIGFVDQGRNRELAHDSSLTGHLATLDLSEASDRVHVDLVKAMFYRWPHLLDFVLDTRSEWADVNGTEWPLAKFASMGSALTFPLETMVFSIIALMGMKRSGCDTSPKSWGSVVSIYGDDIIIPTDAVADVVNLLSIFGFKVNEDKSFWTGKFRESCGADYYDGIDVSVVRLRLDPPGSRQDAAQIGKFSDFRNRCFRAGLWRTVKHCDEILTDLVKMKPYRTSDNAPVPSGTLFIDTFLPIKWDARYDVHLHRWVRKYSVVKPERRPYTVDGQGGLLKWFLEASSPSSSSYFTSDPWMEIHEGQERPRAFHINTRGIEVHPDLNG